MYNPVTGPHVDAMGACHLAHPWFSEGAPPVILGLGRVGPAKDFSTLIRAFARVRKDREVRLVIVGDDRKVGKDRGVPRRGGGAARKARCCRGRRLRRCRRESLPVHASCFGVRSVLRLGGSGQRRDRGAGMWLSHRERGLSSDAKPGSACRGRPLRRAGIGRRRRGDGGCDPARLESPSGPRSTARPRQTSQSREPSTGTSNSASEGTHRPFGRRLPPETEGPTGRLALDEDPQRAPGGFTRLLVGLCCGATNCGCGRAGSDLRRPPSRRGRGRWGEHPAGGRPPSRGGKSTDGEGNQGDRVGNDGVLLRSEPRGVAGAGRSVGGAGTVPIRRTLSPATRCGSSSRATPRSARE